MIILIGVLLQLSFFPPQIVEDYMTERANTFYEKPEPNYEPIDINTETLMQYIDFTDSILPCYYKIGNDTYASIYSIMVPFNVTDPENLPYTNYEYKISGFTNNEIIEDVILNENNMTISYYNPILYESERGFDSFTYSTKWMYKLKTIEPTNFDYKASQRGRYIYESNGTITDNYGLSSIYNKSEIGEMEFQIIDN